jgi:hypothetical protein
MYDYSIARKQVKTISPAHLKRQIAAVVGANQMWMVGHENIPAASRQTSRAREEIFRQLPVQPSAA